MCLWNVGVKCQESNSKSVKSIEMMMMMMMMMMMVVVMMIMMMMMMMYSCFCNKFQVHSTMKFLKAGKSNLSPLKSNVHHLR